MHRRSRFTVRAWAINASVAALIGVLGWSAAASASTPADPPGGAVPVAPHFYNGNVEGIRSAGSDTTFFLMQKIGDLYTGAGLYGCTLNSSAGQTLYNSSDPASATTNEEYYCVSGGNVSTTDVNDNWDRTEVTEGVDDIGSSAGQNQLCAALSTPLPVDFARSAKPASGCATLVGTGYAKDGVAVIAYPVNPTTYGTSTTAPYSNINGHVVQPADQQRGPLQRRQRRGDGQHGLPAVVRHGLVADHRLGPADQPGSGPRGPRGDDHQRLDHGHRLGHVPLDGGQG